MRDRCPVRAAPADNRRYGGTAGDGVSRRGMGPAVQWCPVPEMSVRLARKRTSAQAEVPCGDVEQADDPAPVGRYNRAGPPGLCSTIHNRCARSLCADNGRTAPEPVLILVEDRTDASFLAARRRTRSRASRIILPTPYPRGSTQARSAVTDWYAAAVKLLANVQLARGTGPRWIESLWTVAVTSWLRKA